MDNLALCRICLATDIPLRFVNKCLQEMYEVLTKLPFLTDDSRPMQVCNICCARLQNSYKLAKTCLWSEEWFQQMLGTEALTPKNLAQLPCMNMFKIMRTLHLSYSGDSGDTHLNYSGESDDNTEEHTVLDGLPIIDDVEVKQEVITAVKIEHVQEIESSDTDSGTSRSFIKAEPENSDLSETDTDIKSESDEPLEEQYIYYDESSQWSNTQVDPLSEYTSSHDMPLKTLKIVLQRCDSMINEKQAPSRVIQSQSAKDATTHKTNELIEEEAVRRSDDKETCNNYINDGCELEHTVQSDMSSRKPLAYEMSQEQLNNMPSKIVASPVDKRFECDICNRGFNEKSSLVRHIRIHTDDKPYKCNFCSKGFVHIGDLVKHNRIHAGDKHYECEICSKCFTEKCILARHYRQHADEKLYKCDNCCKSFAQKSNLIVHLGPKCDRKLINENLFKCDKCKKQFNEKRNLVRHNRIHTGDKLYKCNNCFRSFNQKSNLIVHLGPKRDRKLIKGKLFKCCKYNEQFNEKRNLVRHNRTHSGDEPYKCNICSKCFAEKGTLIAHIRIHM